MNPHSILSHYQNRQEEILGRIREIVDIESPSRNLAQSRQVVDWVEKQVRASGIHIDIERIVVADGDHLIVRAFRGEGRPILLLGHTDTVHPINTCLQNPTRIEGDRFYGCGIFDMKSNVVLMLEALGFYATYPDAEPCRPITILLSCDEEIGSQTGRALVEREAARAERCLVFEPSSDGRIKTGRKGTGVYTLKAHGVPAHAGLEPEKGANAIVEIAHQIEKFASFANSNVGTTINVTTIRGGTATNVIPEHSECQIDVRFSSMAEAERVDLAIRTLIPGDRRVSLELVGGINRPPLERTADVVTFFENAREVAASFGYDLGETQVGGASDGNFVAPLGVPVLDGLGITGAGAHMLTEHILVSDIAFRATLVTMLLLKE